MNRADGTGAASRAQLSHLRVLYKHVGILAINPKLGSSIPITIGCGAAAAGRASASSFSGGRRRTSRVRLGWFGVVGHRLPLFSLKLEAAGKRSDIVFRKSNRCLSFSGGLASRFIRKHFAHQICNLFDLLRCWRGRRWFG